MKITRFEILGMRLMKNSAIKPLLKHLLVPDSIPLGLMSKSKITWDVLQYPPAWNTGRSVQLALIVALVDNFHPVKLVTYCGLIDSRLAPDVKAENANQSQYVTLPFS